MRTNDPTYMPSYPANNDRTADYYEQLGWDQQENNEPPMWEDTSAFFEQLLNQPEPTWEEINQGLQKVAENLDKTAQSLAAIRRRLFN
jgi:ActR/RegA family two-component response regulator